MPKYTLFLSIFLATLTTDSAITKTPMADSISISVQDQNKSCLETPRWWAPQADLGDGKVLIAGGQVHDDNPPKNEKVIDSVEIVDANTCSSTLLSGNVPVALRGTTSVLLSHGRAAFFGGSASKNIYVYDPAKNTLDDAVGEMDASRSGSAQITTVNDIPMPGSKDVLSDIVVTGGYDMNPDKTTNQGILNTAENIFVTTVNEGTHQTQVAISAPTQSMNIARAGHSITLMKTDWALVIGGKGFTDATKDVTAESYTTTELYSELKLSEAREDTDAVYNAELNVIVVAGGEAKHMEDGKSIQTPSDAIDVIDLNNFVVTSTHAGIKRDEATIEPLPGNPSDHQAEFELLQGVDEKHVQVKSQKVVVKKN